MEMEFYFARKMYNNNILNFQETTTILNAHTKNVWKLIVCTSYMNKNNCSKISQALRNLLAHFTRFSKFEYDGIWVYVVKKSGFTL